MFRKILFTALLFPLFATAQHTIKGTFSPAEDFKWAILYKVSPTNSLYTTNTEVDKEGKFTLQLDSTVTKGMYRLVYALPQEIFNFDIIYNGEEDIELTFTESEGAVYTASNENMLLASYEAEMSKVQTEINKQYANGYKAVKKSFQVLETLQNEFENASEGTIASHFIKANKPYIPSKPETIEEYIANAKTNYFKNIDFNNTTLQSSRFLGAYCFNYIQGFVGKDDNLPTAYENNIDTVFGQIQNTEPSFQQALLQRLWEKFVDVNRIPTANYIAENYLIPVSQSLNDTEMVRELTLFKNLSIGVKAPDFSWNEEKEGKTVSESLYTVEGAQKYVVAFWSSACSHCLKEMPKLHTSLKGLEPGSVKVIAVGLEEEPYDWKNRIYDYPDFTNVLGLGKWENEIGNKYAVDSTPSFFLLDEKKQIIAKPESTEELIKLLEAPSK
ncbi:TlpA family protein disulfide reductase [Ulvibacter litoralis]|uniref:AhpC/TSA family protein n=1 Tax=Ulvibacter litoralis TaxID=227084 RepID=A0A1G7DJD5_9FLAO|nr:TlpA disulfide reductase family protein [Ulvibacter litoralis]GHC43198.1 hypothetical protein GCM10008083_01930 [Ulvibacter litoralis]SDE51677.1 AhpC/TSA family protein [Ulvibacter litoralis]